jgi:hypothetical protein
MRTLPDVTVPALEIAPVGDLKLKIAKGRGGGRIQKGFFLKRSFRKGQ